MLSAGSTAGLAACRDRTLSSRGGLGLYSRAEGGDAYGAGDVYTLVLAGAALRIRTERGSNESSNLGDEANERFIIGYPGHLKPVAGWRFATVDQTQVFTIEAIKEEPTGGAAMGFAICLRK